MNAYSYFKRTSLIDYTKWFGSVLRGYKVNDIGNVNPKEGVSNMVSCARQALRLCAYEPIRVLELRGLLYNIASTGEEVSKAL